jgi:hypothetical protein
VVLLVVGKTNDDGGLLLHQAIYAVLLYWIMAALILRKQGPKPSKLALFGIRNGVLGMFLLVNGIMALRSYLAG